MTDTTLESSPRSRLAPWDDADPILKLSVAKLRDAYHRGELTPLQVTSAALARCSVVQEKFNAFARIDEDRALQLAAESERRWNSGGPNSPIDGIPGTIKDIVQVRGLPVQNGSKCYPPDVSEVDAPSVDLLTKAGMVTLGITTTPEFGWKAVTDSPAFGATGNPWNPLMTPGGSSGGAAVAAATSCGNLHLGTDGGGSIRIPASFTGICGHKPTYGRVPANPQSAFGSVAHIGPMARSLSDLEDMLAVMSGRSLLDWGQTPWMPDYEIKAVPTLHGAKIAVWDTPPAGSVAIDIARGFSAILAALDDVGAELRGIALPDFDLPEIFKIHWYSGAANRLAAIDQDRRVHCDPGFLEIAEAGSRYTAVDYVRAGIQRTDFGAAMDRLLEEFDVLISPATSIPAFEIGREIPRGSGLGRWIDWAGFSFPINLSQQPATVIPAGMTGEGLPFGLQIVAGRGKDATAIAFAKAIEFILSDLEGRTALLGGNSVGEIQPQERNLNEK